MNDSTNDTQAYAAAMTRTERTVLGQVVGDVEALLAPDTPVASDPLWLSTEDVLPPDDPAVARLLPDASRDDPEVANEFRRLTQEELRTTKVAGLRALSLRLSATPPGFDPHDVVVLMDEAPRTAAALTDVRLVLAERLGLRTDDDAEALAVELSDPRNANGPRRGLGDLYQALTWWQETLIHAMTESLPDDPAA
ncbi:MAG: DUF2017 domain-containing protein [Micrococcales bacterium]|nr:DUF2017 domain-containing protein [Micrococcales bacterium]MCL2668456.1 DUF2017 domain-containing protein [Micrococcales bacterium]